MLFEVTSKKSLDQIGKGLEDAAARHKFGIIGVHDLKQKMKEKGVEFNGECMIYEVCNPMQAKKVLEVNGAVSTALPCRISVYRDGDAYKVATMLPTEMMKAFDTPGLEGVAREVEDVIVAMMRESAV
jgi:uncharacterized protein (DUF302 family)